MEKTETGGRGSEEIGGRRRKGEGVWKGRKRKGRIGEGASPNRNLPLHY